MTNLAKLREFIADISKLVGASPPDLPERAADRMARLIATDDWLSPAMTAPHPLYYQQHLLYADPRDRFSLVSFVWGPGQQTPIHDHTVWGVIGVVRGAEIGQRYELVDGGAPRAAGPPRRMEPGECDIVSPLHGDVHRVCNAHGDRVSVSVHLYGGNIGDIRRHVYDARSGAAKAFVSGYSSVLDIQQDIP